MSDTTLQLPQREPRVVRRPRKTLYEAGAVNTFPVTRDAEEVTGYLTFKLARLINLSARVYDIRDNTDRAISVNMGLVLDDPEIGLIDESGDQLPHPLCCEERYKQWQEREPKFVRAQQSVQRRNFDLFQQFVNRLGEEHGWNIVEHPRNPEGSQRRTRDLVAAFPSNSQDRRLGLIAPENYGIQVEAFEVSVNPDYAQKAGFISFVDGLDQQLQRWEASHKQENEERRNEMLLDFERNAMQLGGIHYDNKSGAYHARPVDVGMLVINGEERALYRSGGGQVTEDLFSDLFSVPSGDNGDSIPATAAGQVGDLTKPDAVERPF